MNTDYIAGQINVSVFIHRFGKVIVGAISSPFNDIPAGSVDLITNLPKATSRVSTTLPNTDSTKFITIAMYQGNTKIVTSSSSYSADYYIGNFTYLS